MDTLLIQNQQLQDIITKAVQQAMRQVQASQPKQWMTIKEAANYAGVSYNTFMKFRAMGLKIFETNGVKRVSKTELDDFLHSNSF